MHETQNIEDFIFDRMSCEDRILMEAHINSSIELEEKVSLQRQSYELIRKYGRQELRKELGAIDREIFYRGGLSTLKERILKIFSKTK